MTAPAPQPSNDQWRNIEGTWQYPIPPCSAARWPAVIAEEVADDHRRQVMITVSENAAGVSR